MAQWGRLPFPVRALWIALHLIVAIVLIRAAVSGTVPGLTGGAVAIAGVLGGVMVLTRHLCGLERHNLSRIAVRWWWLAMSVGPTLALVLTMRVSPFGTGCVLTLSSCALVGGWHWWSLTEPLWFEATHEEHSPTAPRFAVEVEEDVAEFTADSIKDGAEPQQWFTRSAPGPMDDLLEGTLRVEFAAGCKLLNVHVPFSPPFSSIPTLECETVAEGEVRHKVAAVYRYGARVELRRSGNELPAQTVELHLSASTTSSAEAA